MRVRCIAPYTAKMAMGHVASSAPGASQMYMSVLIGSCGSSGPVITLKPLWGSPGTELSTWSTGSLCCIRAIQRTRIASRPLRSYTAIQRYTLYSYTSLYTIQAIQHPSVNFGIGVGEEFLVTRVRSKHAALITNSAHIFYLLECAVPLKARCQQRSQSGATGRRTPWQPAR